MPRYRIKCTAEAIITEVWEADAESYEGAENALYAGDADFIEQSDVDGEDNREVISIEVIES